MDGKPIRSPTEHQAPVSFRIIFDDHPCHDHPDHVADGYTVLKSFSDRVPCDRERTLPYTSSGALSHLKNERRDEVAIKGASGADVAGGAGVTASGRPGGAERGTPESSGLRRHFDPLQSKWVVPSGTLAERKDVQASLRGCDAETA